MIDRIVTSLLLLALVAITLGFASFVPTPLRRRASATSAARVQMVNASVDPHPPVCAIGVPPPTAGAPRSLVAWTSCTASADSPTR